LAQQENPYHEMAQELVPILQVSGSVRRTTIDDPTRFHPATRPSQSAWVGGIGPDARRRSLWPLFSPPQKKASRVRLSVVGGSTLKAYLCLGRAHRVGLPGKLPYELPPKARYTASDEAIADAKEQLTQNLTGDVSSLEKLSCRR